LLLFKAAGSRGQDHQDLRCPGPVANHRDLVAPPHLPGGKPGSGLPPGRDFSIGSTWAGPPGVLPCEFQLFTRSSTKRPPPPTEPGSSCRRIWPAPNASPPNEGRTRGTTDLRMSRGRLRGSAGAGHPISPSPRTLALAGREPGRLRNPSLAERRQQKEETSQDQERLSALSARGVTDVSSPADTPTPDRRAGPGRPR
jgi:hypothetical protein